MELSDDTAAIFDKGLSVGLPGQPTFYSKKLFEVGRHVVMLSREKKNIFSRGPPFLSNCLIDFMTLFSLSSN